MKAFGKIEVTCEKCDTIQTITADQFTFECEGSDEREMGSEFEYSAEEQFHCSKCGKNITVKVSVWEYPEGVFNTEDHSTNDGVIKGTLDFDFSDSDGDFE